MFVFSIRELQSVGVKGIPSEGGYYFMPDFAICKSGFAKKGIFTGKEMCHAMLKEFHVAVRFTIRLYRQITLRIVSYHFSSRLTATLNLCPIYLKLLVHVL